MSKNLDEGVDIIFFFSRTVARFFSFQVGGLFLGFGVFFKGKHFSEIIC